MSIFDPATSNKLPKNQLNFNLTFQKDVFLKDIETKNGPDGVSSYYRIPYDNSPNINFSYSKLIPAGYTAINFFYFGILHNNVKGLSDTEGINTSNIVGELVVECSNTVSKAYLCFFLSEQKSVMGGSNTTDNIFKMIKEKKLVKVENVALSDDIPNQTNAGCFIYSDTTNKSNTVVLFLNPINVNSTTSTVIRSMLTSDSNGNSPLFSINGPIVQTSTTNIGSNPGSSGANIKTDNDNIYIDCNPSGESEDTIQTYNLPINSELMGEKNQKAVMKTSLNFFMFIIFVLFVYITVPKLYKKMVIDGSNKFFKENSGILTTPLVRVRSIDMWLSFIIIFICYILFKDGFEGDNFQALSTAMYLVLIFGLSVTLIQSNKANEQDYMKTVLSCGKVGENYLIGKDSWEYTNLTDFFRTLSDGLVFYVTDVLKVHVALFAIVVIFISISNAIQKKAFGKEFGIILSNWAVTTLPISFIVRTFM
jgi:hypothetical protein